MENNKKSNVIYVVDLDDGIFVHDGVRYEVSSKYTNSQKHDIIAKETGLTSGTIIWEYGKQKASDKTVNKTVKIG